VKGAVKAADPEQKPQDTFTVAAPKVTLPKGGGAISGIGEKFTANAVTGTGSLSVPIALSPGRGGFGPQLSLSYDSGSGNGPFGLGWSMALPAITRRTDKGLPLYDDMAESDIFVLSGAEDLVRTLTADASGAWTPDVQTRNGYTVQRYRPRIEGLFSRIERWTRQSDGDTHWRSITRDNVTSIYGRDASSRITDPADARRVFAWLISDSRDDKGNAIVYEYTAEDSANVDLTRASEANRTAAARTANRYLKRIKYGNTVSTLQQPDLAQMAWLFEAVFDYGEGHLTAPRTDSEGRHFVTAALTEANSWPARADAFSRNRSGFEVRTYRLCHGVLMFHHFAEELGTPDCLVRATEFTHTESPTASFITNITQCGFLRQADGSYLKRERPPLSLQYSQAVVQSSVQEVDPTSLANLPTKVDGGLYQWLDLDGEGLPGVLAAYDDVWYFKRNVSPLASGWNNDQPVTAARFEELTEVARLPGFAHAKSGRHQFLDLTGDGRHDCVIFDRPMSGFYKRTADETWEDFTPLPALPNIDWNDPNLRFIDLNGDGHADILITEHDAFTWYPSLAEGGFDEPLRVVRPVDEERGPAVIFADGTQSIQLADMTGDGLTDLVRIGNGTLCYWPNIGQGQFGAKITMDDAPWLEAPNLFDPRRVRLADVDGSGTADLVYLTADGVTLYFNHSGNGFSPGVTLPAFPRIDDMASVQVMDLLGNGTACLVWMTALPGEGSRVLRYVDLMGGQKPHLLIAAINNLGAETRIRYAPSTKFYLQDRAAGHPWATKLPFPVHVAERVETLDRVSRSRFIARYAYHHGYFDGSEREFRGFAMVEQWDTEELGALTEDGHFPDAVNIDAASYVPPILTKTWFHTGGWPPDPAVTRIFAGEYFSEAAPLGLTTAQCAAMQLPDSVMPANLTADETREALRALKGSMLRQEIYAMDGSPAAALPYSVTEQNFTIAKLQPFGPNRHAVFLTHARESLDQHYERKLYSIGDRQLFDPRTTHSVVLSIDDYGNPLQTVACAYGRRHADPNPLLTDADRANQARIHVTASIATYTNAVIQDDVYRTPLPAESSAYELVKVSPNGVQPDITDLFSFEELAAKLAAAGDGNHDLAFEDVDATGAVEDHPYRRLTAQTRTLYRRDDLSAALPLHTVESRAIPFESHKLALSQGLLGLYTRAGRALLPDPVSVLRNEGGYVAGDDYTARKLFPGADRPGNWWVPSGRISFTPNASDSTADELALAISHFFLVRRYVDPFNNATAVSHDAYDLLVLRTTDALENTVTARNDYRVLQPALIADANGNRGQVAFDALGLVAGTAVMGKASESLGDTLDDFMPDLTQAQIDRVLADPGGAFAAGLLARASARIVYNLSAYAAAPSDALPACAASIARHTHVADLTAGQASELQVSLGYTDGFGREIQKKLQASPDPLLSEDASSAARWITSGWTIFNNKGNPVRKYEPFFEASPGFKFGTSAGVSPILFYDPAQRVVATLHPDHSWEKVVIEPWREENWDVNDTVLVTDPTVDPVIGPYCLRLLQADYLPSWYAPRSAGALGAAAQDAAEKAAVHAGTPSFVFADTLGRHFLTIDWNKTNSGAATLEDRPRAATQFDISGNAQSVIDALGRPVVTTRYDMLGIKCHEANMDAGERWSLNDATGKPLRHWDSRGNAFRNTYDALHRPAQFFVQTGAALESLAETTTYGETQPSAVASNLRGRMFRHFDGAGVVTHKAYDFKGNLLSGSRQLLKDYKHDIDWGSSPAPALESETFTSATIYDAMNRPIALTTPDGSIHHPSYDKAGLLTRMDINLAGAAAATPFVTSIIHDAKGLRERICYGNGVTANYRYDPTTFRPTNLTTTRPTDQISLQDLSYTYDPAGNITHIQDNADIQNTVYFKNQRIDPSAGYTYDALYRLVAATGREHLGQTGSALAAPAQVSNDDGFRSNLAHPGDSRALATYVERYRYDGAGNIISMAHVVSTGNWTRNYLYDPASNRLLATSLPGDLPGQFTAKYTHDAHGNVQSMPQLALMQWDAKDQLRATQQQAVTNGAGVRTYYVYDSTGQRVRKVTESALGTRMNERIYLGPGYDIYREYTGGNINLERQTLHVMDDKSRVALVETRTQGTDYSVPQLIRYQFSNHLGSSSLELDDKSKVISYEEYFPYGSTSYLATDKAIGAARKRYRYTGAERDEESGLNYHSARYFAPWLGIWISPDPAGIRPGLNQYAYCHCDPVGRIDPGGTFDINWRAVGRGALCAAGAIVVVGVVVATAGAAAPLAAGGVATFLGASAATTATVVLGTTAAVEVGTGALVLYGTAQTAKGAVEVVTGREVGTGRQLKDAERSEKLGEVAVGVAAIGLAAKGRGSKAPKIEGKAPAPKLLPEGPPRAKALPEGPPAPKALPPGPPAPKALPPGPSAPKALPEGPPAPKQLGPGPEPPKQLGQGSSASSLTVKKVLDNPDLLKGQSPGDVEAALGKSPGWRIETLGKGSHEGQGWVLRQYTPEGNPTGRMVRWHPGGGHHGPGAYWRVTGGAGGKSGVIR